MTLPMCDVCGREVDSMQTHYDHLLRATVFTVHCHGRSERMELADRTVVDSNSIEASIAFKKSLEPVAAGLERAPGWTRFEKPMLHGWRPISELHEDMGTVVAVNVDVGAWDMALVHVCDVDFDPALWTHFTQITPLTAEDVIRMRAEP